MPRTTLRAQRAFAFPVRRLQAIRRSSTTVQLRWSDGRNRVGHVKAYRVFRNGRRIATLGARARSFRDTAAWGRNRYTVQVVDNRNRLSRVNRVVARR